MLENKKIVFLGSPKYGVAHLKKLYQSGFSIVGVITQPDKRGGRGKKQLLPPPVKKFALEAGLDILQPENINTDAVVDWIKKKGADILVVVAYGQILRRRILKSTPYGTVNVHPSLLPQLRGAAPLEWALLEGKIETGVSIMRLNLKMDAGKIYAQQKFPISENDTIYDLYAKAEEIGGTLLQEVLIKIFADQIEPHPQEDAKATYCKKLDKVLGKIDFSRDSALQIWNRYRALLIWPQIYFEYKEKMIKLTEIELIKNISGMAGQIIDITPEGVIIATSEGGIKIKKVKPSGKKEIPAFAWLNGIRLKKGDTLRS